MNTVRSNQTLSPSSFLPAPAIGESPSERDAPAAAEPRSSGAGEGIAPPHAFSDGMMNEHEAAAAALSCRVGRNPADAPDVPVTTLPLPGPLDPGTRLPNGDLPGPGELPVTIPRPVAQNATIDLGPANQRDTFTKTAELYSGSVTAGLVSQLGPMVGSHTASRHTAVSNLAFEDKRNFFHGAEEVEVELVAQHTLVHRTPIGGQLVEQQERGVIDQTSAVRVRLERGDDGVYRAAAGDNQAFFMTSSETGYATRILENIKFAVVGDGHEDSAFNARYDLF